MMSMITVHSLNIQSITSPWTPLPLSTRPFYVLQLVMLTQQSMLMSHIASPPKRRSAVRDSQVSVLNIAPTIAVLE